MTEANRPIEIVTANGCRLAPVPVDPYVAKGAVYAIVHRETGRVYIGITKKTAAHRWYQHFRLHSKCPKLTAAIRKHGAEAFDSVVLAHGLSASELTAAEQNFVRRCEANGPHGFNRSAGGEVNPMECAETRARLRETMSTPEYRARHAAGLREAHARPETKARHRAAVREAQARPEVKAKIAAALREAMARPEVKARLVAGIRESHSRPEVRARIGAAVSARRRAAAKRHAWVHDDGRTFLGCQMDLVEAFPSEGITKSGLSGVVCSRIARHKGWRLAAYPAPQTASEIRRMRTKAFEWAHADGRRFAGGPTELVEAFPSERLVRSGLSTVASGKRAHHKGWSLASACGAANAR